MLCTSFLNPSGYIENLELSEEAVKELKRLDEQASKLLKQSFKFGDVYIVTNAAKGWVEYSSQKYMPKTD